MKNLLLFFMLLLFVNCSHDNEADAVHNLILNPSFENSNGFDLQDWESPYVDSNTDTPNNGGNYSLQLVPGWLPDEGYAETSVTNLQGNLSFHFSSDVKVIGTWTGKIVILKEDANGTRTEITNVTFDNTNWDTISFNFNASLSRSDLLIVHLSAGSTELSAEKVLFDNVSLIRN